MLILILVLLSTPPPAPPPDYIDRGRLMGEMDATLEAACTGRILLLDLEPLRVCGNAIERTAKIEIADDWKTIF